MTAFWDRWWFLHPENKKNLCIPIVFLGVRLHVWYIAHLSIKGSISRRFVSITSTLCMTAWFYFVCIWHRYFSDVHHDLLSCSVHIVDGYMSSLSHNDVCGYSKSFVPCCISSVPTSYIKATHSSSVRHKTCGHFSFGNQTKWFRIPESSKNILKFRKRCQRDRHLFKMRWQIPFFDKWSSSLRRLEWTRVASQWPTILIAPTEPVVLRLTKLQIQVNQNVSLWVLLKIRLPQSHMKMHCIWLGSE